MCGGRAATESSCIVPDLRAVAVPLPELPLALLPLRGSAIAQARLSGPFRVALLSPPRLSVPITGWAICFPSGEAENVVIDVAMTRTAFDVANGIEWFADSYWH
jgi:hypothetical protein